MTRSSTEDDGEGEKKKKKKKEKKEKLKEGGHAMADGDDDGGEAAAKAGEEGKNEEDNPEGSSAEQGAAAAAETAPPSGEIPGAESAAAGDIEAPGAEGDAAATAAEVDGGAGGEKTKTEGGDAGDPAAAGAEPADEPITLPPGAGGGWFGVRSILKTQLEKARKAEKAAEKDAGSMPAPGEDAGIEVDGSAGDSAPCGEHPPSAAPDAEPDEQLNSTNLDLKLPTAEGADGKPLTDGDAPGLQARDQWGNVLHDTASAPAHNSGDSDNVNAPAPPFSPRSPKVTAPERGSPRPPSPGRYDRVGANARDYREKVAEITGTSPAQGSVPPQVVEQDPVSVTVQDPEVDRFLEGVGGAASVGEQGSRGAGGGPSAVAQAASARGELQGGAQAAQPPNLSPQMANLMAQNPEMANLILQQQLLQQQQQDVEVRHPIGHNELRTQQYSQVGPRVYDTDYSPQKKNPNQDLHWSDQFVKDLRRNDEDWNAKAVLVGGLAAGARDNLSRDVDPQVVAFGAPSVNVAMQFASQQNAQNPHVRDSADSGVSGGGPLPAPTKYVLNPAFLPLGDLLDSVIKQFRQWLISGRTSW
eukprot:g15686.t1